MLAGGSLLGGGGGREPGLLPWDAPVSTPAGFPEGHVDFLDISLLSLRCQPVQHSRGAEMGRPVATRSTGFLLNIHLEAHLILSSAF